MAEAYSREHAKIAVAKILQTIGWHTANTTPLEILTDVLVQYISQMGRLTNEYANEFGFTEPNLDHLGLVFKDFHINLADMADYCKYVNFIQGPCPVPKYPLPKEDHLNFLKPGSKEVLTRPVHIHEHLPPMYPLLEAAENESEETPIIEEPQQQQQQQLDEPAANNDNSGVVFKKPADILPPGETFKRPRLVMEEEGRPTREISSVMMTTSGFLSPAREGKLPESRTPLTPVEVAPPIHQPLPPPPPTEPAKKPTKVVRRVERKKDRIGKELFKPDERIKKAPSMKDIVKLKQMKTATAPLAPPVQNSPLNMVLNGDLRISPIVNNKPAHSNTKLNKALVAARQKTEKLNTTITPIPMRPTQNFHPPPNDIHVDKLFTEPDKKKVNILKKISNVKDKSENKLLKQLKEEKVEPRAHSPALVIDDKVDTPPKVPHISNDITIELVPCPPVVNEKPERNYFDESPPGTPSTPKTPEMISQSPPLQREKRKRKDKSKVKKVQKTTPPVMDTDEILDIMVDRPKTPEVTVKPETPLPPPPTPQMAFPFIRNFCGPGLIPPLNNPLYQPLPFPQFMHGFGQSPYMPPPHLPPFLQPPKQEELQQKVQEKLPPPITIEEEEEEPELEEEDTEQQQQLEELSPPPPQSKPEKKSKEHKKDKKDKTKKKSKKDKTKSKAEKKKLKEERKEKLKKEKKEKRKEKELQLRAENEIGVPKLTLKLGSASPCATEGSHDTKKLNIKPIVKKDEDEDVSSSDMKRELTPELAKISALVTGQPKPKLVTTPPGSILKEDHGKEESVGTHHHHHHHPTSSLPPRAGPGPGRPRIHPIKPKPAKIIKQQLPVKDAEGNEVWICPACGKQDDGSPMIGCDDCDAWYHWVCVNIQVAPADNEDWYCRQCLARKQEALQSDKKKKRKKKEKKDH